LLEGLQCTLDAGVNAFGRLIALEGLNGINRRRRGLAPTHLPKNLRIAVLVSVSLQVSGDFRSDSKFLVFQNRGEPRKIGSKPADDAELSTKRENGESCAGRNFAKVLNNLLPDEGLILRLRVKKIEQ